MSKFVSVFLPAYAIMCVSESRYLSEGHSHVNHMSTHVPTHTVTVHMSAHMPPHMFVHTSVLVSVHRSINMSIHTCLHTHVCVRTQNEAVAHLLNKAVGRVVERPFQPATQSTES